jgi:hypothetical protein
MNSNITDVLIQWAITWTGDQISAFEAVVSKHWLLHKLILIIFPRNILPNPTSDSALSCPARTGDQRNFFEIRRVTRGIPPPCEFWLTIIRLIWYRISIIDRYRYYRPFFQEKSFISRRQWNTLW